VIFKKQLLLSKRKTQKQSDKYASLRTEIKEVFYDNQRCYGYRRVHATIKGKGTTVSEKVIRRIMKEEQLIIPYKKNEITVHIREK
jgi:putative transposase